MIANIEIYSKPYAMPIQARDFTKSINLINASIDNFELARCIRYIGERMESTGVFAVDCAITFRIVSINITVICSNWNRSLE